MLDSKHGLSKWKSINLIFNNLSIPLIIAALVWTQSPQTVFAVMKENQFSFSYVASSQLTFMTRSYEGLEVSQPRRQMSQGDLTAAHMMDTGKAAILFRLLLLMQLHIPQGHSWSEVDVGFPAAFKVGWRQADELGHGLGGHFKIPPPSWPISLCPVIVLVFKHRGGVRDGEG